MKLGALIIFLFVTALNFIFIFNDIELVSNLENKTWDFRVSLLANKSNADKRIKLIDVDQYSLDFFENEYSLTWPLPRSLYKHVISFLKLSKAKGLAFDMLFTESSAIDVEGDKEFALATALDLPIVSALMLDSATREVDYNKFKLFSKKQLSQVYSSHFLNSVKNFNSVTLPIIELIESSPALGNVQAEPDADGTFRQYSAGGTVHNVPVYSLPFALYQATNGIKSNFDFTKTVVRLHGGRDTYRSYSLASIIQSQAAIEDGKKPLIDPSEFKDSWVILGSTAAGLLDLRPTSLEEKGGGLHFVAAILDNLINDNFIKKTSNDFALLLSSFLSLLALCSTLLGSRLSLHILRILALFVCFFTLSIFSVNQGLWMPVVIPTFSIVLTAFLGLALQYRLEGKQHRFIREAFKFYVSPSVVEQIVVQPSSLKLGGQKKEVSMFFSDIVGFTSISEKLDPELLVKMLNDYLSLFTKVILDLDGTVDKYVGDAVMAFWNAPLDCSDHAQRAVNAAIRCQKELEQNRKIFENLYGIFPDTRIGINTAEVNVGNFGSRERFNYTLIGDGVNLASRLEGANKNFGTRILLSENTKSKLEIHFKCRVIADLVVLGKSKPIRVYEPDYGNIPNLELYNTALAALENNQIEEAKRLFEQLADDPVASSYLKKITKGNQGNLLTWNLSEK